MKINVFKNIYFYAAFIAFFLWLNYYLNWTAFSFWNIWIWSLKQNINIWEKFVKQTSTDDTVLWTALANIKLWEWDFNYYYYIWEAVQMAQSAQMLVNNDTLELLESSANKQSVLEWHLTEMELLINKSQDMLSTLQDYINEKKTQAVLCETNKKTADSSFFQWLSSNEKDLIVEWLTDSVSNWQCYNDSRIFSNAYQAVYDKLNFYTILLQEKKTLIENNQDSILENYWVFRDSILEKLIDIRDRLSAYNTATIER